MEEGDESSTRMNRGVGMLLSSIGGSKDRLTEFKKPSAEGKSGNTSGESKVENRPQEKKTMFQDEDVYGPKDMTKWTDIKEYNDDGIRQWFQEENARLAELYGGNYIVAKYLDSQPERVGYYCELCYAEMNARKSLELHCSGMRHLKKKAMWEKSQGNGDEDGDKAENPPPPPPPRRGGSPRGRVRDDLKRKRAPSRDPPFSRRPPFDYRGDDRDYWDDRRNPDPWRPAPFNDDYYREMYDEPYGRGNAPRDLPPEEPYDYGFERGRRDIGSRFSKERYSPYGRHGPPPPPTISGPPPPDDDMLMPGRRPPLMGASPFMGQDPGMGPGPDEGGPQLLKVLGSCRVNNTEDAILATNVVTFLLNSLREFYSKHGTSSIVHVLEETVVKFSIMRELQNSMPPH